MNSLDGLFSDFERDLSVADINLSALPAKTAIKSPEEEKIEFSRSHHGMMSGSSIGLIVIEPASEFEIIAGESRVGLAASVLSAKGIDVDSCTYEEACAKRAKGLYKEWEVASRALNKLKNTEFGEAAKSYLDEIVSQRRRVFNPERPRAFKGNAATEWGNGKELEAIAAYEDLTGLKLEKTGDNQEFIHLGVVEVVKGIEEFDFTEWFGCTPDSVTITPCLSEQSLRVGSDFDVYIDTPIPREFKNPSSGVVFDRYRTLKTPQGLKKENRLYYWQVIAQMACLDAPYAQWIAYDCDVINEAERFVVIDFERDMAIEQVLINSLLKAAQYIQERI